MAKKPPPVKSFGELELSRRAFQLYDGQHEVWDEMQRNRIIFLVGPAGTGKTHLAVAFALHEMLRKGADKIILTRPMVEAEGEKMGFLPGDIEAKAHPYMMPFYDMLDDMVGRQCDEARKSLDSRIEIAPLAFLRGRTMKRAVCILDEAQNCTAAQLKLFMTRLGRGSKMVITGDPGQSDRGEMQDLTTVAGRMESIPGITVIRFDLTEIVRDPMVGRILENW